MNEIYRFLQAVSAWLLFSASFLGIAAIALIR